MSIQEPAVQYPEQIADAVFIEREHSFTASRMDSGDGWSPQTISTKVAIKADVVRNARVKEMWTRSWKWSKVTLRIPFPERILEKIVESFVEAEELFAPSACSAHSGVHFSWKTLVLAFSLNFQISPVVWIFFSVPGCFALWPKTPSVHRTQTVQSIILLGSLRTAGDTRHSTFSARGHVTAWGWSAIQVFFLAWSMMD